MLHVPLQPWQEAELHLELPCPARKSHTQLGPVHPSGPTSGCVMRAEAPCAGLCSQLSRWARLGHHHVSGAKDVPR